jgi:signal transduction histidine kinase/CheY-like chemotaxis protein
VPITGIEMKQPAPDGTADGLDTIVSYYPVRGAAGAIDYVGLVVADITERKRAESAVRHAQKLESIGVLAGGIAHDFNNLLTGIMGNASLAGRVLSPGSAARAAPLLNDVVRAAQRAADLTSQLLAYAGKGRFFIRKVELGTLAGEISSLLRSSIPRKVELRLTVDPATPAVEADASQLQQLVMNLVLNGAEAIGDESGSVTVNVYEMEVGAADATARFGAFALVPGRYAALEVTDTGCGMDDATLAQIFDPFFTTKFTGRGLGLAAALGIVRGHHGGIAVRSAPGQGTTFTVVFPGANADDAAAAPPAANGGDAGGEGLVLVVDDEDVVRRTARLTLDEFGYAVLTAADGAEAVEVFRKYGKRIGLVVLDLTMPVMGGEETITHLRAIDPGIPVLVMSGYGEAETMRRFDGTPADGFLQKPFGAPQLAAAVRAMLGRRPGAAG